MIRTISDKSLRKYNTFGLDVKAARFVEYGAADDLCSIQWYRLPQPVISLGEGSNLLFTGNFPGTVLHSTIKGIEVDEQRSKGDDVYVCVGSGVKWDDFCDWAARKELWGPENLSAIPGTVGAAPVQNIGAYGVEAADIIDSVHCYDIEDGRFVSFSTAECQFGYRDSFFKHHRGRYIVVSVVFHLYYDFRPRLEYAHLREEVEHNAEIIDTGTDPYRIVYQTRLTPAMPISPMLVRNTVKIIRENKLPDPSKVGSAGSFFKNPVVTAGSFARVEAIARETRDPETTVPHYDLDGGMVKIPAAWLIEFCGFKGMEHKGAAVWNNQPLVLVNRAGKASPQDILELEKMITDKVKATFDIELSPEVDHI